MSGYHFWSIPVIPSKGRDDTTFTLLPVALIALCRTDWRPLHCTEQEVTSEIRFIPRQLFCQNCSYSKINKGKACPVTCPDDWRQEWSHVLWGRKLIQFLEPRTQNYAYEIRYESEYLFRAPPMVLEGALKFKIH